MATRHIVVTISQWIQMSNHYETDVEIFIHVSFLKLPTSK